MRNLITFNQAVRWSTSLFGLLVFFHLGIIIGILVFDFAPVDYLWGGRMETSDELLRFEIVSLIIMLLCLVTVLIRSEKVGWPGLVPFSRIVLWILVVLFLLNTIGNLLATTLFEKFFSVVTIVLAMLSLRMALESTK